MKQDKKEKCIKDLSDIFKTNNTFFLFNYENMTVAQSVELRKTLRKHSFALRVVKNRLALRALHKDFPKELRQSFQNPTAIAYTSQNPINLARLLKEFSAQNNVLTIKGGLVEGHFFLADRFDEITKLSSKQELLGKIAYFVAYPLMKILRTWQAPLNNLGSLLSQLKIKK